MEVFYVIKNSQIFESGYSIFKTILKRWVGKVYSCRLLPHFNFLANFFNCCCVTGFATEWAAIGFWK